MEANTDRELSFELIKKERFYARQWSEASHHPDDHAKITWLLREVDRLKGVISSVRAAVREPRDEK